MEVCLALVLLEKQKEWGGMLRPIGRIIKGRYLRMCAYGWIVFFCFLFPTNLVFFYNFPQGYPEGSHYSEHESLSSPFISSGVAGKMVLKFTVITILKLWQKLLGRLKNVFLYFHWNDVQLSIWPPFWESHVKKWAVVLALWPVVFWEAKCEYV